MPMRNRPARRRRSERRLRAAAGIIRGAPSSSAARPRPPSPRPRRLSLGGI
jgi:hypothetical protein